MAQILIVDDDPAPRERWKRALELEGHSVQVAPDAIQGLINITRDPPDLILSDILMPRMDGFTFIREVKSRPDLRTIPFLFVTSTQVSDDDRQFAQMLGAEAIIARAEEFESAHALIDTTLKRHMRDEPAIPRAAPFVSPFLTHDITDIVATPKAAPEQSAAPISEAAPARPPSAEPTAREGEAHSAALHQRLADLERANTSLEVQVEEYGIHTGQRDQLLHNLLTQTQKLKEQLDLRAAAFSAFSEIAHALKQNRDPEPVLREVVRHAASLVRVDSASAFLFNSETATFHGACSAGLERIHEHSFSPDSAGSLENILEQQQPVALCPALPYLSQGLFSPDLNARSALVVPIIAREQLFGMLICADATGDREFTPAEIEIAAQLAGQAGVALGNAQLLKDAQRARPVEIETEEQPAESAATSMAVARELEATNEKYRAQITALSKLARPVSVSLNPQEVLQKIVRAAVELVSVETCNLFLFNVETNTFHGVSSSSMPAESIQQLYFSAEDNAPMLSVFQNHKSFALDATAEFPMLADAFHSKAALIVPVVARTQVLGVLLCVDSTTQRTFTSDEIELLTGLADQAALWLEAAHWYYEANRQDKPRQAPMLEQLKETTYALSEPLVAILDQTRTLLEQAPAPELRLRLESIETHTRRVIELLGQLRRMTQTPEYLDAP